MPVTESSPIAEGGKIVDLRFWIRPLVIGFLVAFVVIAGARLLRGDSIHHSIIQGLLWSLVAAVLFSVMIYRWRRAPHCDACGDLSQSGAADGQSGMTHVRPPR